MTAAQYGNIEANPAAQYNGFVGGNPDLQPEDGGHDLVRPRVPAVASLPGLRLQVDYFDIKIEDAIQAPNADFSLLMCALNGDPCDVHARAARPRRLAVRDSNAGFIVDTFENIGEISTSGIDLDASYRVRDRQRAAGSASTSSGPCWTRSSSRRRTA